MHKRIVDKSKACCFECAERTVQPPCHSTCSRYIAQSTADHERKERIRKAKHTNGEWLVDDYMMCKCIRKKHYPYYNSKTGKS